MIKNITARKRLITFFMAVLVAVSHVTVFSAPIQAENAKYDETFYSGNNIVFYDPRVLACEAGTNGTIGVTLTGDSIEEQVWNFFVGKGLTAEQTAGVMGNISHESGFNPAAIEGGTGIGLGLFQWSFGRRTSLEQAAAAAGKSASDLSFQLEYAFTELSSRGVDYSKFQGKGYTSEWDGLTKQATVEDAVVFFHHEFEVSYLINYDKPGYKAPFHNRTYPSANAAVIGERGGIEGPTGHPGAQYYFDTYSGSTGGGSADCPAGETADISFDMSKIYEDSTAIACAPGTTDAGEQDAYNQGVKFRIKVCEVSNSYEAAKGRGALVNSRVSGAIFEMFKAMGAELGVEKIPVNDSFRTWGDQVDAVRKYPGNAAKPGWSNHQSGMAIDYGEGGCPYSKGVTSCSNNRFWRWLSANAATYQFQQYTPEWWHWSPNGQ